jgi:alpha,alpha-trehalase
MFSPRLRRAPALIFTARLALSGLFILSPALAANAPTYGAAPQPPDVLLGPLFDAVQRAKLYPDQKTFADAVAKSDPMKILADYRMQRGQSGFDLRHFVSLNFNLPNTGAKENYVPPKGQTLRAHINGLWPALTRSTGRPGLWDSLLSLPKSYIVPGGRFREVYYWDSYFTMLGLAESQRWNQVQDMVDNFAYEIDRWGHIPNGNRSYYLSRSQPPFFALMVALLASHNPDALKKYLPQLKKEYTYWMAGSETLKAGEAHACVVKLPDGTLLNRYWDERDVPRPESWLDDITTAQNTPNRPAAEVYRDLRAAAASGWDFSSRWMDDPQNLGTLRTTQIVPVDLNALLYQLEKTLAYASRETGDISDAQRYDELADRRRKAIETHLWNSKSGWYADYDIKTQAVRAPLTAAAMFPLYVKLASEERAAKTAAAVRKLLLKPGGIAATCVNSGQQWDAPNGWAPLQWVTVVGLQHYGQRGLAMEVIWRFLTNVQHTYNREQRLVEKYDVSSTGTGGGGEYPLQDGFGWTNGVTLKMLDLLCGEETACDNVPQERPGRTPAASQAMRNPQSATPQSVRSAQPARRPASSASQDATMENISGAVQNPATTP